jgi:hypothetical protein
MNTVWVFGDSFSADYDNDPVSNFKDYIKLKGYVPKTFGKILSERYNMEYKNHARGGFDNYSILESFCDVVNKIEDGDIIFLGWSLYHRFRIMCYEGWKSINGTDFCDKMSTNTINEIVVNRTHPFYEREVESWNKLIRHSIKSLPNTKLIIWEWHKPNLHSKFETISQETNNVIPDFHWSENGHKEFLNYMLTSLK